MHTYLLQFFSYYTASETRDDAKQTYILYQDPISFDQPITEAQVDEMSDKVEYHLNSGKYGEDYRLFKSTVFARVYELTEILFDE